MAILRSLKNLTTKNAKESRSFLTSTTTQQFHPFAPLLNPYLSNPIAPRHPYRFLSRPPLLLPKWIAPFQGPLFLSSRPWNLSQSATPLYLRGNFVLRKVEALNLNFHLIKNRTLGLGLGSELAPRNLDRVKKEEERGGGGCSVDAFVNFPNFISLSRLLSGPLLGWMIINEMYSYAFVGLAISGATDWLDGYVARKMKINSVVGSYLDPLADKFLIGCVALAMVHKDLLHPGLVGLVVWRDVTLVGGAVYQRASSLGWQWKRLSDFFDLNGTSPQKVQPLFISKVNTVFQLVLVAAALLQPEIGGLEFQSCVTYLSWLVASTTVASTAAYGVKYMRKKSTMMTS